MSKKHIVVIEGDGIGPEVTAQAVRVLDAVAEQYGHEFEYEYCLMGACAIDQTGHPLPNATIEACLRSDAVLFGAIGDPKCTILAGRATFKQKFFVTKRCRDSHIVNVLQAVENSTSSG